MARNAFDKPHLFLHSNGSKQSFTIPSTGRNTKETDVIPERDRGQQSGKLRGDLATISKGLDQLRSNVPDTPLEMGLGIQLEFESFPDIKLAVEQLARESKGTELLSVKTIAQDGQTRTVATVFVPDGELVVFEKKITEYLERKKDVNEKPRDHRKLIDAIQSIRVAVFESIWSDAQELLPRNKDEPVWWEVWLSTPKKSHKQSFSDFQALSKQHGIFVSNYRIDFPEHAVFQVKATQNQLASDMLLLSRIAEVRLPKETADFFSGQSGWEQAEWSENLLSRLQQPVSSNGPYICILDTGVNVEHPLLSPFANINDQLSVMDYQHPVDNEGHGTNMAGLAMWGDLTDALASNDVIFVGHRLESVKVIDKSGDNKEKSSGYITSNAVAVAEWANPERDRVYSMSLSANIDTDKGRASSWSSTLDTLAVDYLGEGDAPRLFTVSAGNASFDCFNHRQYPYPHFNIQSGINDPAQAWNVVTVGAFTNKAVIRESNDHYPLAKPGGLSPYSTTSHSWDWRNAPLKPDVVFEGGNIGHSQMDYRDDLRGLQLLTTHHDFSVRHYETTCATSAATAQAARFAAQIKSEYPDLWPETIRALMIHSAEWTDEMLTLVDYQKGSMGEMARLVRAVGFGVPNLEKALRSANNSFSLIIEDQLQPFQKNTGDPKTKDMHWHDLPWPKEILQFLGDADVELTVTLSYFIEPNPSSRNILNKYSYASHQLRFDTIRPFESMADFQQRINKQNRSDQGFKSDSTSDKNWTLGVENRHRGSIHKDIWKGSAADLADLSQLAVYPVGGWWKTRKSHQRWDSKARYSLIISLSVPKQDVNIYSDVKAKVEAKISSRAAIAIQV